MLSAFCEEEDDPIAWIDGKSFLGLSGNCEGKGKNWRWGDKNLLEWKGMWDVGKLNLWDAIAHVFTL